MPGNTAQETAARSPQSGVAGRHFPLEPCSLVRSPIDRRVPADRRTQMRSRQGESEDAGCGSSTTQDSEKYPKYLPLCWLGCLGAMLVSSACLQKRYQICQLLHRELLVEPGWHDRRAARDHLVDVLARDAELLDPPASRHENDFIWRVLTQDAAEDPAVAGGDDVGLVAAHKASARKNDTL